MAAKTAIKEPKRSSALVRRETFASYCFLLPSLIFFLGFVIYPMILCVVTSFFDSTMNRADIFVGMANYKTLFADPIFLGALKNTFVIVILANDMDCISPSPPLQFFIEDRGYSSGLLHSKLIRRTLLSPLPVFSNPSVTM